MGIFDFLKGSKSVKVKEEKPIDRQLLVECLAYAHVQYRKNPDYDAVSRELAHLRDVSLTSNEITIVIETLRKINEQPDHDFQPGQEWHYKTRSGEETQYSESSM